MSDKAKTARELNKEKPDSQKKFLKEQSKVQKEVLIKK